MDGEGGGGSKISHFRFTHLIEKPAFLLSLLGYQMYEQRAKNFVSFNIKNLKNQVL